MNTILYISNILVTYLCLTMPKLFNKIHCLELIHDHNEIYWQKKDSKKAKIF